VPAAGGRGDAAAAPACGWHTGEACGPQEYSLSGCSPG